MACQTYLSRSSTSSRSLLLERYFPKLARPQRKVFHHPTDTVVRQRDLCGKPSFHTRVGSQALFDRFRVFAGLANDPDMCSVAERQEKNTTPPANSGATAVSTGHTMLANKFSEISTRHFVKGCRGFSGWCRPWRTLPPFRWYFPLKRAVFRGEPHNTSTRGSQRRSSGHAFQGRTQLRLVCHILENLISK